MARFNLDQYETVESRIKRFYEEYPDGRIITSWESSYSVTGEGRNIWVVKTEIYLSVGDQANKLPKSTGYATETDGTGGANSAGAALENCETSSIGRALANLGMSGNKRASREEMEKVVRADEAQAILGAERDWVAEAKDIQDVAKLRMLYAEAKAKRVPGGILKEIEALAKDK